MTENLWGHLPQSILCKNLVLSEFSIGVISG